MIDKIFKLVTNNKKKVVCIAMFLILGIPIFIHILFLIPAPWYISKVKWEAADFLGYYGSVLTCLGTIFLGWLALEQNEIIENNNNIHTKKIEEMDNQSNMPIFVCKHILTFGLLEKLELELHNISENPANNLKVNNFNIITCDKNKTLISSSRSASINENALPGKEKANISFTINKANIPHENIVSNNCAFYELMFEVEYDDKYKNKHKLLISKIIESVEDCRGFFNIEEKTEEKTEE